jgi:methylated-DNA-[protein]-cysteine S-methyltransferase
MQIQLPECPPQDLTLEHLLTAVRILGTLRLEPRIDSIFLNRVWAQIRNIPRGSTLTYSQLATEIGAPKAARAVGSACASNPLLLLTPCHRVTAARDIGGYSGGLLWKQRLLEIESH